MRSLGLILALGTAVLACEPRREPLTVRWTFDGGKTCAQAGVATVRVDIEGETLSPNQFACAGGATTGADLGRYLLGTYQVTITGIDGYGDVAYQDTAAVRVERGGSDVTIDVGRAYASMTLLWAFNGATCAQAGVSDVAISLDGEVITDANNSSVIPCTQAGIDGATIEPLSAGHHTVDVVAYVNDQPAYQLTAFDAVLQPRQDTPVHVNLQAAAPTAGYADIAWTFDGKTCAQSGVTSVVIVYDGKDLQTVPCHNGNVDGVFIESVPPGMHSWAIRGLSGAVYAYRTQAPVTKDFAVGLTTWVDINAIHQ